MYVVCVTVFIKPGTEGAFLEATRENARETRCEPRNVKFDVLQSESSPGQFFLYEVYRDAAAFKSHQETAHYLKWREAVADWMAQPRQGMRYHSLFPEDPDW